MILALFVSLAAGFCIGSGSFLEQGEKNEEDQILCSESQDLYIHYRVHQGNEYQDKFPVDTPITYRCGVGYLPRDIKTWNATCRMRSDGSLYWDIDKFDCRPVSCGHPGDIRWGRLMDAVFVFPRQVRYQCNKGYRMIGDAQLYCQSDGTWNSVKPECQIVDCGPLDGIANGTVQLHSTQYGSKAEFTCNNGFKLTGTSTRTCDADGQWTDESPHCEEIWCPQPDLPEGNGTTSLGANPGSQRSGTRLQYFCPQKTVLVGSEINICQETGSWLFDPPVCTPNCVVQADPSAAVIRQTYSWRSNNQVALQPGSEVPQHEERLFVQCQQGYEFIEGIGKPHLRPLRCQNGAWHPPGPWCKEKPCRNVRVQGGEPEVMDVLHNEVMNFTCKPNHELQKKPNDPAPVCRFGNIYGVVPICKPDDCRFEELQNRVKDGKPRRLQPTSHGSFAVYDCEFPLVLKGPGRLRCSYGIWTGEPPTCVPRKECTVPRHVGSKVLQKPHWSVAAFNSPTEMGPGTIVNEGRSRLIVKCEDGYHFRGEQHRREKQADLHCINGTWYPNAPWCEKIDPEVPPGTCTLPRRAERFKAHLAHIRIMSLGSVLNGTELIFHCEPVGETILKGPPTSQCVNGQWVPEVPYCYGRESEELGGIYMYFQGETHTVPGGEVYVEPNREVLVVCWSSIPVHVNLLPGTNARIQTERWYDKQYFSRAKFTLQLGDKAYVVCRKADKSERQIKVLGHHLYRCPEIPKMDHMEVRQKNREVYEFSCHTGYRLQGKRIIHCLGQGVWSESFPTCVPLIEASSARTTELDDDRPMKKSTPVVQGSESSPADTQPHSEQGMAAKPVQTTKNSYVDESAVQTPIRNKEPVKRGGHGHDTRNTSVTPPQHSHESATNQRAVHLRHTKNALNNTRMKVQEASSSHESTTGHVSRVDASTEHAPMLQTNETVQPALDLMSQHESSRPVICDHSTASSHCSDSAYGRRPTQRGADTAAGVANERHEGSNINVYSKDSSSFNTPYVSQSANPPQQEVKPKAPSLPLHELSSVTDRPSVSSSTQVPAIPMLPEGPYEPSPTKDHSDVRPVNCTLLTRQNSLKAHHKHIRILPLESVPHGTELIFHCEPVGETILRGSPTSRCNNGQWVPRVPDCFGKESRDWDNLYMHLQTETYTAPGGVVYVEPNREVLVDCSSITPVQLFVTISAQLQYEGLSGSLYVSRAKFTLLPDQRANILCRKADNYNSFREIKLLGHDLYSCPEMPKTRYLKVEQENRDVYKLSCQEGYRIQGKSTIHCFGQGVWSDPFPTCVPLIEASSDRTTEPEVHNPINDTKSTSVVQAQNECHIKDFYDIAPPGLVIVAEDAIVPLNSTFWPSCDGEGYTLVGNSSAVTCLRNGSWHVPPQMKCIEGCVDFDTGPNGPTVVGRKGSYALGDSITLSCSERTQLQPRVERIICLGYSWSEPAVPVCVPVQEKTKKQRHKKGVQSG